MLSPARALCPTLLYSLTRAGMVTPSQQKSQRHRRGAGLWGRTSQTSSTSQSCAAAPRGKHSPAKTTSALGTGEELPLSVSCEQGLGSLQPAQPCSNSPRAQQHLCHSSGSAHLNHLSPQGSPSCSCGARGSQETPDWDSWGTSSGTWLRHCGEKVLGPWEPP